MFITPEKYLYVISAKPLRELLSGYFVEEVELLSEDAFGGILAYPAITVLWNRFPKGPTRVKLRNGTMIEIVPPRDGSPWLAVALAHLDSPAEHYSSDTVKLKDIALRISAGVATGLDEAFVIPKTHLPKELEPYAYPTVSGADLARFKPGEVIDAGKLSYVILVPYTLEGKLLDEERAKQLISYLARYKTRLEERTAARVSVTTIHALLRLHALPVRRAAAKNKRTFHLGIITCALESAKDLA